MKNIVVLGSTGSIGISTLDVIRQHPELYRITGLATGSNAAELRRQAAEFDIISGPDAACELIRKCRPDMVVNGIAGAAGFLPSLTAVECGAELALANKESLVIGGSLLTKMVREKGLKILPVDSEHSAIFQCLQGEPHKKIRRLILTASGGPFRATPAEDFSRISPQQALKHPTWDMGQRITIDSATMMNKALEIIEAAWLFDVAVEDIQVAVHPTSIVHSMVEFEDMSIKAQMGYPDMRLPIAYALSWPDRFELELKPFDFSVHQQLDFYPPDEEKFPALKIARQAMQQPATLPCIMNAADEVAIAAFLDGHIRFDQIVSTVQATMHKLSDESADTAHELVALDRKARAVAQGLIK